MFVDVVDPVVKMVVIKIDQRHAQSQDIDLDHIPVVQIEGPTEVQRNWRAKEITRHRYATEGLNNR